MTNAPSYYITQAQYKGALVDVVVTGGCIAAMGPAGSLAPPQGAQTVNAAGLLLFPSFIDSHVHLREPGYTYKEDITSGLAAAAHGGFGAVMAMANTKPVNDNATVTEGMLEKARQHWPHGPVLYPVGALTVGLEGKELAPMGELADAGCPAFSNDGWPVENTELFRRAMEYAAQFGRVVIDHCEDPYLAKGTHMNEGEVSSRIGVKGQSTVAEALHVARDILLAEYLNLPVHLAHISCRQSAELIAAAKNKGVKVTAETCPHYLLLDETAMETYDSNAKMNPPLRPRADVEFMRKAVQEGVFDMFVTDHAPHAPHEKEHPLDHTPNGIIGLETAVPLTYGLVREGLITEEAFIRMWHDNPVAVFGLTPNKVEAGAPACFFLFNPTQEWVMGPETSHSKSRNTPYWGKTLQGKVIAHFLQGVRVV